MRGGPRGEVFKEKHGLRGGANRINGPPEYKAWDSMIDRCCNPRNKDWKWYGAKGVTVAAEWRHDAVAFIKHVGPRPSPKHSLDRYPNREGSYEPGNVRWATPVEQARNRSNNRVVTYGGKRMVLIEAAEAAGLRYSMVVNRLSKGWTELDALSIPAGVRR